MDARSCNGRRRRCRRDGRAHQTLDWPFWSNTERSSRPGRAGDEIGKLSRTNGGAIQVYADAFRGKEIMAHLLLANGEVFHQGPLRITKGKFINAPKRRLHEWFWACGRHESDLAGRANDRNTVYAFQTGDGSYCLHFAEQKGTSSGQSRTERLAAIICADFYENRLDLLSSNIPPARASWDGMPEVEAARQLRAKSVPDDALRMFLTFVAAMDRARDAAALWRAGVALIESHPEVFDPCRAADLPFSTLKRLLADPGVSQRHEPDTKAWRRIAWSLAAGDGSRVTAVPLTPRELHCPMNGPVDSRCRFPATPEASRLKKSQANVRFEVRQD